MSTRTNKAAPDTRTPARKEADEAIARAAETGDWTGFTTKVLLTPEGARKLIEFSRDLDPAEVRSRVIGQPFRWKEHVFQIVRCDYADGKAHVEVAPQQLDLVAELQKRVEKNRFHILPYYQGFGFIALPEDHARYEE